MIKEDKIIHYYYRVLVIENKIISHEYFYDKMQLYELYDILNFVLYTDKTLWETTRFLSLIIALKFCKKKLKLKDMFSLPWDNEKHSLEMSKEAEEKNRYFLEYVLQMINKKTDEQKHG